MMRKDFSHRPQHYQRMGDSFLYLGVVTVLLLAGYMLMFGD
jgi:hypothetical protein